jgi:hypothetical protein
MRTQAIDRLLLGTALVVAMTSIACFGWPAAAPGRNHRESRSTPKQVSAAGSLGCTSDPIVKTEQWLPPIAQSRGPRWVYDLFTPPAISYDAQTGQFDVTPPNDPAREDALAAPPGVELVAVRREPFRLQLVGYVGREGRYLGTFENLLTTEVFLAGPGRQVPALGLEVTDFTVQHRPVPSAAGTTSSQRVAIAVVRDTHTGRCTSLTAGERTYTDELCAVLANDEDGDEITREVHPGEEFQSSDHTYKIERLQLDPPAIEFSPISSAAPQLVRLHLSSRTVSGPTAAAPSN